MYNIQHSQSSKSTHDNIEECIFLLKVCRIGRYFLWQFKLLVLSKTLYKSVVYGIFLVEFFKFGSLQPLQPRVSRVIGHFI